MLEVRFHCVLLGQHGPVHDLAEGLHPRPLLRLRLAGQQELALRRDDGDAVWPVVALGGRREPVQHRVAALLAADEDLPSGEGVQGVLEVHEPAVIHGEPALPEAFCLLGPGLLHVALLQVVPGELRHQVCVAGAREGHLQVVEAGGSERVEPVHHLLPVLVVDEDVAGAVVLQVGDLQAVGVADLGWLEGGIQMLDLHDGLGLLGVVPVEILQGSLSFRQHKLPA